MSLKTGFECIMLWEVCEEYDNYQLGEKWMGINLLMNTHVQPWLHNVKASKDYHNERKVKSTITRDMLFVYMLLIKNQIKYTQRFMILL